jgi:N-acetylglutamate synthase-like GNAT family acetyltransferase
MSAFQIRELNKNDKPWVIELLTEHWGSARMVSRGRLYQADELPGFVAIHGCKPAGLATYNMNSIVEQIGIGSALIDAVKNIAVKKGCRRLWLITTNDNTKALCFWQKRGFKISAIHVNAIERSRKIKPEIPLTGNDGIPIRDEIELEMRL